MTEFKRFKSDAVTRPDGTHALAIFDDSLRYRYWLEREFTGDSSQQRALVFCMLNPSTADARNDDPTIRWCSRFAKRWNYKRLIVVNLFALRATKPKELYAFNDPVGEKNDAFIRYAANQGQVIAAWGAHGDFRNRGRQVTELLVESGHALNCLGHTKYGFPKHPLYLKSETAVEPYTAFLTSPL